MKKFNSFLLAFMLMFSAVSLKAQMPNLPAGSVATPEVSTAAAPVWYNMMSSHLTAADRQNRFLTLANDGDVLSSEKFDGGISTANQNDKYLWRLEAGPSGAGYVYIVNKASGKRLFGASTLASNWGVSVDNTGVEWKYQTSASTGQTGTTPNQYVFNFEGGTVHPLYLNVGDNTNSAGYKIVVFTAGAHNASGWFLYPYSSVSTSVNATKTSTSVYPNPFKNSLMVENAIEGSNITLCDLSGRIVLQSDVKMMNTEELQKGIYILKYNSKEGNQLVKVVKD